MQCSTELHKYGIEPLVTLSHFDTPLHLAARQYGRAFAARHTVEAFKVCRDGHPPLQKVKYWLTFNEYQQCAVKPLYPVAALTFDGAPEPSSCNPYSGPLAGEVPGCAQPVRGKRTGYQKTARDSTRTAQSTGKTRSARFKYTRSPRSPRTSSGQTVRATPLTGSNPDVQATGEYPYAYCSASLMTSTLCSRLGRG